VLHKIALQFQLEGDTRT